MQVFILLTPAGHVLGVYATAEAAQRMRDAVGDECRISAEFVQD